MKEAQNSQIKTHTVPKNLCRRGLICCHCGDIIPAADGYYSVKTRIFCADCVENADLAALADITEQNSVRDFLHAAGIYWRG